MLEINFRHLPVVCAHIIWRLWFRCGC